MWTLSDDGEELETGCDQPSPPVWNRSLLSRAVITLASTLGVLAVFITGQGIQVAHRRHPHSMKGFAQHFVNDFQFFPPEWQWGAPANATAERVLFHGVIQDFKTTSTATTTNTMTNTTTSTTTTSTHWIGCNIFEHFDLDEPNVGHVDIGGANVKDVDEVIDHVMKKGYGGFALFEGVAYMKYAWKEPFSMDDLMFHGENSTVVFYACVNSDVNASKCSDHSCANCSAYSHYDLPGSDVEHMSIGAANWKHNGFPDVASVVDYVGEMGYSGFALSGGGAYLKAARGSTSLPLTKDDLVFKGADSHVSFYACDGGYLLATHTTTTTTWNPLERLNTRFTAGKFTSDLDEAGVLVHQWDRMEGTGHGEWWYPCRSAWCKQYSDRFSASLINAKSPPQNGKISLFSTTVGGFVISPTATVLCAYPMDGGSMSITCSEDGSPSKDCIPGCKPWCAHDWEGLQGTCAFHPRMLTTMISQYASRPSIKYNELVIGTRPEQWPLPKSIEAFFYMSTPCSVGDCDAECGKTRTRHAAFLKAFNITSKQVPFLCLDTTDWNAPFKDMSAGSVMFVA